MSALTAVSCASAQSCVAVGNATTDVSTGARVTLAMTWNGARWTTVPTVDPLATNALTGVSCTTATSCTAVGYAGAVGRRPYALVEVFDGTAWTEQDTPRRTPKGGLTAVSCTTPDVCAAVGPGPRYDPPLVLRETGGVSSLQRAAPVGSRYGVFTAVSCAGPSECAASGYQAKRPDDPAEAIFQIWDGTTWRVAAAPVPVHGFTPRVDGLSCSTVQSCRAVGRTELTYPDGEYRYTTTPTTLATSWDGSSWTPEPTPNGTGHLGTQLTGVSCVRASTCLAVGSTKFADRDYRPRATAWNGTRWVEQPQDLPRGINRPMISDVSCSGVARCLASGYRRTATGLTPIVAQWAGGPLAYSPVAVPTDDETYLYDVSCPTLQTCFVVGSPSFIGLNRYAPLIESRTGSGDWVIARVPRSESFPTSISCATDDSCVAVGNQDIVRFDGQSWAKQHTPSGSDYGDLSGVSCVGDFCAAIGTRAVAALVTVPYVEVAGPGTGGKWVRRPVPFVPTGPTETTMTDISCASTTACVAVGFYRPLTQPGYTRIPLAFRWDGARWTQLDPPTPERAYATMFAGVSCPGTHVCYVVGSSLVDNHDDITYAGTTNAVVEQVRL